MEEAKEREIMIRVKDLYKIYKRGETKVHARDGVDFEPMLPNLFEGAG